MSFNVLTLITVAGRKELPQPGRWRTPLFDRQERFLIQSYETKNGIRCVFLCRDFSRLIVLFDKLFLRL
jgi:hypothetical protein